MCGFWYMNVQFRAKTEFQKIDFLHSIDQGILETFSSIANEQLVNYDRFQVEKHYIGN